MLAEPTGGMAVRKGGYYNSNATALQKALANGGHLISDEELRKWLLEHPENRTDDPTAVFGATDMFGVNNTGTSAPRQRRAATGPYDLDPDGGPGWGANGVNLYNALLARGDMPAPGAVGRGPGFWIMDNYGTPFWRSDWDHYDAAQGKWLIKGEN